MTFPNLPVATVRVARITQRDRSPGQRGSSERKDSLPVVDLLPLVMAIWSLGAIWDIHGRLPNGARNRNKRRIAVPVQEERP